MKALVGLARKVAHRLPEVKHGLERGNLLLQALDQFAPGAIRDAGNVIDGFVGIELSALATHMRQGIDHMAADALQAQLKHLKQADGA